MCKVIPIAFSSSNQYAQHLCVAMTSILENNRQVYFKFFILHNNISEDSQAIIQSLKEVYFNCDISFITVDITRFKHVDVSGSYLSLETYYRLLLADILPDCKKILFLDSDLIVNGNIEPLFDTDISEYYFGGVEERCLYGTGYIEDVLKFTPEEIYINAGVLLCNLKKIRDEGVVDKFFTAIELLKGFTKYDDQDVINIVGKKKIKKIDCIYNFTPYHLYELYKRKYDAVIIHYTGKYKPWSLGECPNELRYLYFKYLEKSPYNRFLKVRNFCIYHKNSYLWETDSITPIQTGSYFTKRGMDMLQASTGDSIDYKNKNYGELTAWYWVWKNFIPNNPNVEYIGFCHYRRFLDFHSDPVQGVPVVQVSPEFFVTTHNDDYSAIKIYDSIRNYDVILPSKVKFKETVESQYLSHHPKEDLEILKNLIKNNYSEYYPYMQALLSSNEAYFNLVFTMRTDLACNFFSWVFSVLRDLERLCDWSNYNDYNRIRTPAYLIERLFNVWLEYNKSKNGVRVLERKMYLLCFDDEKHQRLQYVADNLIKYKIKKVFLKVKTLIFFGDRKNRYKEKYKGLKELIHAAETFRKG